MKNLKLLSLCQNSNIEAECFCLDLDENVHFAINNKVYSLQQGSNEISICADLESENNDPSPLIGMEHVFETNELCIASSSGEIYVCDLSSKNVSSVGVVDSKIEGFAWSPDQQFLVILTGADSLILMTREFYPITEKSLCPEEFGESKPITVGWGSKETQFHGSEGKEAAKIKKIEAKPALPYDDGRPRISWRGDGKYFVTSSINSNKGFRQLRIWSNEAILQYTGEIKDGLEEPVCWRPAGNVIACSQQDANKHKIIFFETNGLQHGDFSLPFKPNTHKVTHLLWNSDSTVLLVAAELIEDSQFSQIMLWTCGNYHWYLKQSFTQKTVPQKPLVIKWSAFYANELFFLNQATKEFYKGKWGLTISGSVGESEDAIVASVDSDNVLITPFAQMVVPPPMSAYSYNLTSRVQNVCFAPDSPEFCCHLDNSTLVFFWKGIVDGEKVTEECKTKLVAAGGNGFKAKVQPYLFLGTSRLSFKDMKPVDFSLCHFTWAKKNKLICVGSNKEEKCTSFALILFELPELLIDKQELIGRKIVDLNCSVAGISTSKSGNTVALQFTDGHVYKLNIEETSCINEEFLVPWMCDNGSHLTLPQPCITMSVISICGKEYFLGLTERFSLYCNETVISYNCTSYCLHNEYLLITTTDNTLKFFLIDWDLSDLRKPHLDSNVLSQRIEKGARIIIAPLSGTNVILQMPRGNLESIHPRPLVLSHVCSFLENLQFDKAFELSKVHRIDLNILCDHNPKVFLENVKLVVEQLKSSTNLNLFLGCLENMDVCETMYRLAYRGKLRPDKLQLWPNKIDVVCTAIRKVIEGKKDDRFFLTLIATYAKKNKAEIEEALIMLKGMKDANPKDNQVLIDTALNFLMYLVDVNELINVALGTYDLEITVMVAQKSQKDPKEYLPFYNELNSFEENYRKYKIDMHLQRFKKALEHISKSEEHFDECLSLIRNQRLYVDSLYLFPPSSDRYKIVWKEYGNYLMDKRYFDEAGLAFTKCEDYEKSLMAYKESLNWQSMLCAAMQLSYSDDRVVALCIETAEKLKSNHKYLEASYLLEQYVKNIEESITILVDGWEWNAALLLISKYGRHDLLESIFKPALFDHFSNSMTSIDSLYCNFNTHNERLKVIRTQKQKEAEIPDIIKHHDEELFSETDSVTDVASSYAESKQLSGSIVTRKSSKSRRKQKLKKYRLKEGSPDEDLALIVALSEIVIKIDNLKDNFLNTLKTLVQFGYDKEAKSLQQDMLKLVAVVDAEIPVIWKPAENSSQQSELKFGPDATAADSIAAFLRLDKQSSSNSSTDPELAPPPWRKMDLSLQMFK